MNRRAALFLLLYLAVILYLSLYPWRFVPIPGPRTLILAPLDTRRSVLDAFLNLVFYMPLGAAALLSLRRRGALAIAAALVFGTLVSFFVEFAQLSLPNRVASWNDLFCNSAGTLLGASVAFVTTRPAMASWTRILYSPRALLLGLWLVWQAFLFLPRYGPTVDIGHEMVGLVVLVVLAARGRIRSTRLLTFLAMLLLIWLAAEELRPFRFQSPPQPFWWLPFESWFMGAAESYYGILFGKVFLYTSVLWVERTAGIRWKWALLAPGAILFAGELAQRYLPGRTPELTDLALLVAGAVLLHLAEASSASSLR